MAANNKPRPMSSVVNGLYSYTLSLTGVPGTGKTSIFNHIKRKADNNGNVVESGTLDGGIDCCIYSTVIDGKNFKISLYDTGGLERYASLTSNYFHRSHAVILVYHYCIDSLETITGLGAFIENALRYNRSPSYLVFAVWGHDYANTPDSLRPKGVPDLAKALMESNDIPVKNHRVVSLIDGDDSRLMDALDDCILAVHKNTKPRTQSVLTPGIVSLRDSLLEECSDEHSVEKTNEEPQRKRTCCSN